MARTVVGLDIGGSGVRAAEFTVGRKARLRKFASVSLPEGVVKAGRVVDAEALSDALKELWGQGKFGTKEVVLGIANDGVLDDVYINDTAVPHALRVETRDLAGVHIHTDHLMAHIGQCCGLHQSHVANTKYRNFQDCLAS